MKIYTDFLGQELAVGDTVILIAPRYRLLTKAEITEFTPQKVRVKYVNIWNYRDGHECNMIQDADQLVKVNGVVNHANDKRTADTDGSVSHA